MSKYTTQSGRPWPCKPRCVFVAAPSKPPKVIPFSSFPYLFRLFCSIAGVDDRVSASGAFLASAGHHGDDGDTLGRLFCSLDDRRASRKHADPFLNNCAESLACVADKNLLLLRHRNRRWPPRPPLSSIRVLQIRYSAHRTDGHRDGRFHNRMLILNIAL